MAVVRTIDPQKAILELQISPGCEDLIFELLGYLKENEDINLSPRESGVGG